MVKDAYMMSVWSSARVVVINEPRGRASLRFGRLHKGLGRVRVTYISRLGVV